MGARILVIDDDVAISTIIAMYLRRRGYEVTAVNNGRAGLGAFYELGPELILLDIMMPEMDGWEVCRRVREVSEVPILLVSALAFDGDVARGLRLGADDYLRKPFALPELAERVSSLLGRSKTGQDACYDDGVLRVGAAKGPV